MELGIVMDEGEVLPLFWRVVGLSAGRCIFNARIDSITNSRLYSDNPGFEICDIFVW
jgi:hypothetical protein